MIIEVKGANFVNKGAELMLLAILQEMRDRYPDSRMVVQPKSEPFPRRAELKLWQKFWFRGRIKKLSGLGGMVPKRLRRRYGVILDREIEVILDASGFLYSDQFPPSKTVSMARDVRRWKRRDAKVILLPQAMGPFASRTIAKAFTRVIENCDLVFPRDARSYRYVTELVGRRENIIQAPDFTTLLSGKPPPEDLDLDGRVCLVPNIRMIDKTDNETAELYPRFCARCIKVLENVGYKPLILIHEGEDDVRLAEEIADYSGDGVEIVEEDDSLLVKGILGHCSGVIGSRFHALVSALSQGVPVLATGWSHKYEMLLDDYGLKDACLSVMAGEEQLSRMIERTFKPGGELQPFDSKVAKQKDLAKEMWKKVFEIIDSAKGYPLV